MNSYLDELNPEQKQAVLHTEGPLLVVAGAGTGKTKTLTYRIRHLIHEGVSPDNILAITFTNKAAAEMRERALSMIQGQSKNPWIRTFHSLGVYLLRTHHQVLGLPKHFKILDQQDARAMIKEVMKRHDIDPKMYEPRTVGSIISKSKGKLLTPESLEVHSPMMGVVQTIWSEYERSKTEEKSLDFDDLLVKSYNLLADHKDILAYYQDLWKYVHIDEYQDTNTIQYNMVKLLAEKHSNICAVGDGDQNIYSWRGADMRNILNFEKDFSGARVIVLETNYRSTQNILAASHDIISKNTQRVDKKLVTQNEEGAKIAYYEGFSASAEAYWVADRAHELIADGVKPSEIGVLFRTNFQSRILEEAFLYNNLPYQVVGVKFFSRKEIKDIMAYLRAALNPESLSDIKRIINEPKRSLGKVSVAKIFAGQAETLPAKAAINYKSFKDLLANIGDFAQAHLPSETLKYIIEESGFKTQLSKGTEDDLERLENMQELVSYAQKYDHADEPFEQFLEEVALLSDQDSLSGADKEQHQSVKLMTIHASKGLEFEHVFVVGLEQGLFPSQRDDAKSKHEDEEERRLCYVAFTRAKKQLYVSYARMRTIYGQQRINEPSEFLRDLNEELLDHHHDKDPDSGESIETVYLDF